MNNTTQSQMQEWKLRHLFLMGYVKIVAMLIRMLPSGKTTFFSSETYPWIKDLEAEWKLIRAELDKVLTNVDAIPNFQDLQPEQGDLTKGDKWKTFVFNVYGLKLDKNLAQCPETADILREIPGLKTAMFSILKPGLHIPPHEGPFNGVLRVHLGLKIPVRCGIKVGADERGWTEGKCMVFDDYHTHEAWNKSDTERVVLFMDIVRPLPFPLNIMNEAAIKIISQTPFIQNAFARAEKKFHSPGEEKKAG